MSNHDAPPCHPRWFQRSPIDFRESLYHPFDNGQVDFIYPLSEVHGRIEGEAPHCKLAVLDTVRIPLFGMQLKLEQLHFHAPAEHLVSGVAWPLELHLLHSIEGGQSGMTVGSDKLVMGTFFLGTPDAPARKVLHHFGEAIANARKGETTGGSDGVIRFNPNHCLPDLGQRSRFYRYEGSLTSGNLDETVSWLVFERPVPVVDADLKKILKNAKQEPRKVEDLNRRAVLRSFQ